MIWVGITISVWLFCLWCTLAALVTQAKRIADAQERMAAMYPVGDAQGEEIKHG